MVRNGPDLTMFKEVPPVAALEAWQAVPGRLRRDDESPRRAGYAAGSGAAHQSCRPPRCSFHVRRRRASLCQPSARWFRSKELTDFVNFTGRVPDEELLQILSTADVCVNPDRTCEMNNISTMIKIMEYMALGKPIVQFESKEGRVSAQSASLYANGADPVGDFAAKILYLLDHPAERETMGRVGTRAGATRTRVGTFGRRTAECV